MRASKNMSTNVLIVIGIVFVVSCFVCAGLASDTFTAIFNIIAAPFRAIF
jgi:hypothetical protein